MRQDMINQKEGETEMNVKIHYDKMVSGGVMLRRNCSAFFFSEEGDHEKAQIFL